VTELLNLAVSHDEMRQIPHGLKTYTDQGSLQFEQNKDVAFAENPKMNRCPSEWRVSKLRSVY